VPIGIWIFRNYLLTGEPFGVREHSIFTIKHALVSIHTVLWSWFTPTRLLDYGSLIIFTSLLILILFIIVYSSIWKSQKIRFLSINSALIFVIIYSLFLALSSGIIGFDKIDDRLMSPVYIPIVFLICFFLEPFFLKLTNHLNPKLTKVFIGVFFLLLASVPAQVTYTSIQNHIANGAGFTSKFWRERGLVSYINQHNVIEPQFNVFSNFPDALYILTDIKSKKIFSRKYLNVEALNINMSSNEIPSYLIWFNEKDDLIMLEKLQKVVNMNQVVTFSDSRLYLLSRKF